MSDLMGILGRQLSGDALSQIGSAIGADEQSTQKAIAAALPALLGGLARNATSSSQGATALASALDRDHDGSVLDDVGGLLSGFLGGSAGSGGGLGSLLGAAVGMLGGGGASKSLDGDGILGHVLGDRRATLERGVSRASGLDLAAVAKLLPLLAPMVMGALGRLKHDRGLDAGGLAGMLSEEQRGLERRAPGMKSGGLMDMLDQNDDGSIADDLARLAGSGLFR